MWHPGLVQVFFLDIHEATLSSSSSPLCSSLIQSSIFSITSSFQFGSSSHCRCKVLSFTTYPSYFVLAKLFIFVVWTECGPVFVCIEVDFWGILSLSFSLSLFPSRFISFPSFSFLTRLFTLFFATPPTPLSLYVTFVAAQHLESHCQTRLADSTRSPTNVQKPCCTYLVHVRARVTWQSWVYVGKEP